MKFIKRMKQINNEFLQLSKILLQVPRFILMSTPAGSKTSWSWQTYPPTDPVPKGSAASWTWEALAASLSQVAGDLTVTNETLGSTAINIRDNSDPTASHNVTVQAGDAIIAVTSYVGSTHAPIAQIGGVDMTSLWEGDYLVFTSAAYTVHIRLCITTGLTAGTKTVSAPSAGSHFGVLLGTRILRPSCA